MLSVVHSVARGNTKSACTGVATFLSPRDRLSSKFCRVNKECSRTYCKLLQNFVYRWEITDWCLLDSHWDPYCVSRRTHTASFIGPTHTPLIYPNSTPFGRKESPLFYSHWDPYCVSRKTHTASFLAPTHTPLIYPNSTLFWTKRVSSLLLTLGPIFRPQKDPYSLTSWTNTASYIRTQLAPTLQSKLE